MLIDPSINFIPVTFTRKSIPFHPQHIKSKTIYALKSSEIIIVAVNSVDDHAAFRKNQRDNISFILPHYEV